MPTSLSAVDFLAATPVMLDVRSPSEYAQGHIPGAISFPLFTDDERAQVGICYKHQGRYEAVELGFAIVGPKLAGFIAQAKELAPDRQVRMYCWRGGMRSGSMAWALEMAGFQVSLLIGGYKAFRHWTQTVFTESRPVIILGGMTGTGKTNVLAELVQQGEQVLDLEALASHRGSSFGSLGLPPQPSNEQFENRVAMHWARLDPARRVWVEAESKRIGTCRIPESLFQQISSAPVLELERTRAERLALLVAIYGKAEIEDLIVATERIRKRLGGLRTQQAVECLKQRRLADACDLILDYYDKTYRFDLERRGVSIYPVDGCGLDDAASARRLIERADHVSPDVWMADELAIAPH